MSQKHGRTYWYCPCGRWTWASKSSCIGCKSPPPSWVQQRLLAAHPVAPTNAEEQSPNASGSGAWVSQPRNKRQQSKARAQATAAAERSAGDDAQMDDVVDISGDEDEQPVTNDLESVRKRVSALEAVDAAARDSIPGFDEILEAARNERDELQRSRRAARPVHWRLVEAQAQAKSKGEAVAQAQTRLAALQQEQEKLSTSIAITKQDLLRAKDMLTAADEAVADIYKEIASESRHAPDLSSSAATSHAVQAAQGIATQLGALPAALVSGNAESAVVAIQQQVAALVACLQSPGTLPSPQIVPPFVPGATRPCSRPSGRRGTSPARSDASGSSTSRSRSSRVTSKATEAEICAGRQHRLDDLGFRITAASDPYDSASPSQACG